MLNPGASGHDGTQGEHIIHWDFRPRFAVLADWLNARRELVLLQWAAVTEANASVRAKAESSLLDHLPSLFDDLIERLRQAPPSFDRLEAQVGQHAREHAVCRWEQGFALDEMLGGLATLRTLLIDHLAVFEAGDFRLDPPACTMAQRTVHGFLDDVSRQATQEFMRQQREATDASQRELRAAKIHFEQLADSRLRLTRTLAHDLRNTLGSISAATQLLDEEHEDSAARAGACSILRRNVSDMDDLAGQLLSYSSLMDGREPLRAALLSPGRLLADMAASFRPAAAKKGLEFRVEPYPDWHDVIVDESKVRQIVANLLGNAIKYTSAGWVQLEVKPPNGEHWSFIVEDSGCGMTPEEAGRIFEEYYRVPATAHLPGTGLGLSICKQLVERLEGKISLHSAPGQGTRFEVRLPVMVRPS